MKITVSDARALAAALNAGADQAETAGEASFDAIAPLQVMAADSLDELKAAIEHARAGA